MGVTSMVCRVRCPVQLRLEYMYLVLGCALGNIYEVKLGERITLESLEPLGLSVTR